MTLRTVKSAADLRRLALAQGAELEIDGRTFNAQRAKVSTARKPMTPAPAPRTAPIAAPVAAPAVESLSRTEVDVMLAQRDALWRTQLEQMGRMFSESLQAIQARPAGGPLPRAVPAYNLNGTLKHIDFVIPGADDSDELQ